MTTKTGLYCALLRPLVSGHRYGTPMSKDEVIRRTPLDSSDIGAAKRAFDELRKFSFIIDYGNRGVKLDNSNFDELADFLHDRCTRDRWPIWEIKTKLKHYEGWDDHDWANENSIE